MKRFQIRKHLLIFMLLLLFCFLTACGTITPEPNSPSGVTADASIAGIEKDHAEEANRMRIPTENEYLADLKDSGLFGLATPYTINELQIIKSKTDENSGYYSVWLQVASESEDDVCKLSYALEYEHYDNGWLLNSITPYEEEKWIILPKRPLSEDEIIGAWKNDGTSDWVIEENTYDLEAGWQVFTATFKEEHQFCTVSKRIHMEYFYSNIYHGVDLGYASWHMNGMEQEDVLREEWKLIGGYTFSNDVLYIDFITADYQGSLNRFYWHWNGLSTNVFDSEDLKALSCNDFFINVCSELEWKDYSNYNASITNGTWGEFRYVFGIGYSSALFFVGYDRIAFGWDYVCDTSKQKLNITLRNDLIPLNYDIFDIADGVLVGYHGNAANVVIPEGVTTIGGRAFSSCTSLKSVTIPDSVTTIGDSAFSDCTSLESVTIPDSVTLLGFEVFENCTSLESVIIPDSVTEISSSAFLGCISLQSITIPSGVTTIGSSAFSECPALKSIQVAKENPNYQDINGSLFDKSGTVLLQCCQSSDQTYYRIPDGVTTIGSSAFENCINLQSVVIPDSVTEISSSAFLGCISLQSITIPSGVTTIGSSAFSECPALKSIQVAKENQYYQAIDGSLYDKSGTVLLRYCQSGDQTYYRIPDGVTTIGDRAFSGCTSLESVTVPDGVTTIAKGAFSGCNNLQSITIPDSVTKIETWVFQDCSSLKNVSIPDGVERIMNGMFSNCCSLKSVTIPDSVTEIRANAFYNCISLESITIPNSVTMIEESFICCSSLESVFIPASVTIISREAFRKCTALRSIQVAKDNPNYQSINGSLYDKSGTVLLRYCQTDDQTDYRIPDGVTAIGRFALSGCSRLQSVVIPDGVTTLGFAVFEDCTSLESCSLPASITWIDSYLFDGCSNLKDIYFAGSGEQFRYLGLRNLFGNDWRTDVIIHSMDD